MKTVRVELGDRGYDIRIGGSLDDGFAPAPGGARALLVTDSNVAPLHGDRCEAALAKAGYRPHRTVVPAGEATKSLDTLRGLYEAALEAELDRASTVVALGGGMVGDLAGLAAATFLRGSRLVQVPTSLLAMVDSAVGGKTAVNLPQGKNLVGAFHQPSEVVVDLATLETLPNREYVSGLAEVVKYGVIWSSALFDALEKQADALQHRDADVLESVVADCCEIKAEVVRRDEKEDGLRAILNYGHTLAHALEALLGYGEILHGEAVALGMVYAGLLSVKEKGFAREALDRQNGLLDALCLPTRPAAGADRLDWDSVRSAMSTDKKVRLGVPRFVLAEGLGAVVPGCDVPEAVLRETLDELVGMR